MADINVSMGVDNTGALKSLKQVENSIDNLVNKFSKLRSVAVGIKVNTGDAINEIKSIQDKLNGLNASVAGSIKLDNTEAIKAINEVRSKLASLNLTTSGNVGVDSSAAVANVKKLEAEVASLSAMLNNRNKVQVDTKSAVSSLKAAQSEAKSLSNSMSGLKSAIAGIGIATIIAQVNGMAVTVTNLSRATGIGTSTVKAYGDAIAASGGDFRGGVEDLTDLTKAIDDARKGNSDAQISFAQLGIGLKDLSVLSEEDIFKKTISGLASIQDASKRTTMSMALLGGEFKKVDIQSVSKSMNAAGGGGGANVSAIKAASDAQKAISDNMIKLQTAILNVIEPLNKLISKIDVSTAAFESFIKFVGYAAATFLLFTKVLAPANAALGLLNRSAVVIGTTVTSVLLSPLAALRTAFIGITGVIARFAGFLLGPLITAFKQLQIILLGASTLLRAVGISFGSLGALTTIFAGGITTVIVSLAKFVLRMAGVVGIVITVVQALDALIELFFGFSIIDDSIAYIKKLWNSIDGIGGAFTMLAKLILSPISMLDYLFEKMAGFSALDWVSEKVGGLTGLFKLFLKAVFLPVTAIDGLINALTGFSIFDWLDEKLGGISGAFKLLAKLLFIVPTAIDFLLQKITGFSIFDWATEKLGNMTKGLKEVLGLQAKVGTQADVRKVDNKIAEDNPEIFKMPKKEDDKGKPVIDAQRGIRIELQKTLAAYQDQNAELSRTMAFQNQMIGLDDDAINRKQKLFDLESNYLGQIKALKDQYVAMRDAAANGTDEEKNAFSAFASQYAAFAGKITAEYNRQKVQVNDLISAEEVLKDREKQKLIVIEAITKQMERQAALGDIIRGINDKTVDMKFEASLKGLDPYKAEIARINEEARKGALEAGRSFADQFATDDPLGLTPEDTMSLANGLELIAQKYKAISVQQIKQLDESRTWKSGWDEAFEAYADSATNAANMARDAFSSFSSGMDKLIDTFVTTGKFAFGDFAKSVIADLIKIELKAQAMSALKMLTGGNGISGAMSTIGSFFGGFFAEGGQPPLGKASIVGEKGPELFVPKSAGTIVPNGGFGGATVQQPIINNNTYVTNNVSAVDAKSVAQLFQENRKQLFGVIETARKEMPGRTR